jgi:hypothetical protein
MTEVEQTFATIRRQADSLLANSREGRTGNPPSMLDKITTALTASAESSTGTAPLAFVIRQAQYLLYDTHHQTHKTHRRRPAGC